MTTVEIVSMVVGTIVSVLGIFCLIRHYARDSIGELRYMLKCAKERRELIPDDYRNMIQETEKEIASLEKKIENHWGRKIASKEKSIFEIIPTPVKRSQWGNHQKIF